MTTVRSVPPLTATAGAAGGGPGERLRRLRQRRRLVREELLTVAVLLLALAATLVVLGLQWLDSGPSTNPGAAAIAVVHNLVIVGGHT
jgi:hypothetical protein